MASVASLAQEISERSNEAIIEALGLVLALRPELTQAISELLMQEPPERYSGVISAWKPEKQYGFIKSDAVQALYGVDTWVSESEVGPFRQGDEITFSIVMNKKNQPQARLVAGPDGSKPATAMTAPVKRPMMSPMAGMAGQPVAKAPRVISPQAHGGAPVVVPARPAIQQPTQPMTMAQQWGQDFGGDAFAMGGDPSQGRYMGTITCFYPAKHFGFINAPDVMAQFGVDTFLSDKELGEFEVGSTVEFDLCINAKGSPQARNLSHPGAGAFGAPAPMPMGKGKIGKAAAPMGKGAAFKGGKSAGGKSAAAAMPSADGRCIGVITCFYPEKKFGFVQCDAVFQQYGVDTFLSDKEIGEFQIGSEISFEMAVNAKGQPQARNLGPAGGAGVPVTRPNMQANFPGATLDIPLDGGAGQMHDADQVFIGVISTFKPGSTFGFVKCDEVFALYGIDTFISNKEVGEFKVGDQIAFQVALNKTGKPQAREVHDPMLIQGEEQVEEQV